MFSDTKEILEKVRLPAEPKGFLAVIMGPSIGNPVCLSLYINRSPFGLFGAVFAHQPKDKGHFRQFKDKKENM